MIQLGHNSGTETFDAGFALETMLARRGRCSPPIRSFRVDDPTFAMVHDLRNPLAVISGCAELLAAGNLDGEQSKRVAANVWRASRQMQSILSGFVSSANGRHERSKPNNLSDVVSASCEAAGVDQRGDIDLTIDVPAKIVCPMDRTEMERVFLNLIVNALEAMPCGGAIYIAASVTADQVRVTVEDTGPGIPPIVRDRLFQPFATAGKRHGVGLGLAISRETVRSHGGDLWVESARGARFVLCLPRFGTTIGQKEQK